MPPELELQCECAHCGKSAWHTVSWLKANPSLKCERCGAIVASSEILKENTAAVTKAALAARRNPAS
jgi:uncharacterized Zn finger protein